MVFRRKPYAFLRSKPGKRGCARTEPHLTGIGHEQLQAANVRTAVEQEVLTASYSIKLNEERTEG